MSKKGLNRYRLSWIMSFLLTITIILAVFLMIFFYVLNLTRKEEIERNYSESQFLKNVLDDKFRSIAYLSADIMYRPAALMPHEDNEPIYNSENAYRLVNEMQSHKVSHSEIEDIFVYYPLSEIIVGTHGVRTTEAYHYLQSGSKEGFEAWKTNLLNESPNGYFIYQENNKMQLILGNSLTINENNKCQIYLKINQNAIKDILAQANAENFHQFAALVDEDNKIYASYGDDELFLICGDAKSSAQIKNYYVTVQPSILNILKYVTISDKSQVQQLSGKISFILLVGVLTSGIASVLAAIYFSNRNAKPVSKLLSHIPGTEPEGDAFDYIGKTIDSLMECNSAITEKLEHQQSITAASFLPLIFNGDRHDDSFLTSFAAIYGVDFAFPFYGILVVRFAENQTATDNINEFVEWNLHYRNEHFDTTCGVVNSSAVCLMNWDSEENELPDAPMFHFSGALCDWMQEKGFTFRIGVGGTYQKLSNIYSSYSEAIFVLDKYRMQLCFYDICPHKLGNGASGTVYYEYQQRLLERDYEAAYTSLHELLDDHLFNCTPATYKYRKSSLLQLIHETLCREVVGKEQANVIEEQCLSLLFADVESTQLEQNISLVLKKIIELTSQPHEAVHSIVEKAKQIIDTNYADPTLGLSGIATQLNITGPYLSRAFKQEYQQGISEYISRMRIDHAKELIVRSDLSMKTIALRVGFSSDVNFIRVFKKLENTTPGRFSNT